MTNTLENKQLDVYRAIADANRRKLLDLLLEEERAVQDLMPHMDITLGAVSQHLQILWRSGLVTREKRGRFRVYRAHPDGLRQVYEWTRKYRQFWEGRLHRLGHYLDNEQ